MNVSTNKYCVRSVFFCSAVVRKLIKKHISEPPRLYWPTFITMNTHIPRAAAINTRWSTKCGLIQSLMQYTDGSNIRTLIYILYLNTFQSELCLSSGSSNWMFELHCTEWCMRRHCQVVFTVVAESVHLCAHYKSDLKRRDPCHYKQWSSTQWTFSLQCTYSENGLYSEEQDISCPACEIFSMRE